MNRAAVIFKTLLTKPVATTDSTLIVMNVNPAGGVSVLSAIVVNGGVIRN
jgi:hypothetical protein